MRLFQKDQPSVGSWESQAYFTSATGTYSRIPLAKQNQAVQWASLNSAKDRVVINRGGLYLLFVGTFFTQPVSAGGNQRLQLQINDGATDIYGFSSNNGLEGYWAQGTLIMMIGPILRRLSSGDAVSTRVYHVHGSTREISAEMTIQRIGD